MLEFAFHAQIAEAADLNQQEREQRQAERDVHIRGNRSQSKQSQRASKQDVDKIVPIYGAKVSAFVSEVLLRVIVDFADDQLRGNLSLVVGTVSSPCPIKYQGTARMAARMKPQRMLSLKNASVSEGDDNARPSSST